MEQDREISRDEARLADAGCRKLFNKDLSALLEDFERVSKGMPLDLLELLIVVGRRVSSGA